jgi:hypothetical protein
MTVVLLELLCKTTVDPARLGGSPELSIRKTYATVASCRMKS